MHPTGPPVAPEAPPPSLRGRPRSEEARRAVLDAALRLCVRDGYAGVTMKGIADEAGVGRQTVYRWWSTKSDVLVEALRDLADRKLQQVTLTGETLPDVHTVLTLTFRLLRAVTGKAVSGLMADAQHDRALSDRLQSTVLGPRRDALREILEHGIATGQLAPTLDPALVVDIVFGTMWYRLLSRHARVDDRLAADLVDVVARLLAPGAPSAG
jgi:AcrR family transcriptional regulator